MSLYTTRFDKFLNEHEQDEAWQRIVQKFASFPSYTLGELNLDMYDLFKNKYLLREIGDETESIFTHNVDMLLDNIRIVYIPKIQQFIAKYNSIAEHVVELNGTSQANVYLNPITTGTQKKLASVGENIVKNEEVIARNSSNAELLEASMNVQNIYYECLNAFDNCFVGIY